MNDLPDAILRMEIISADLAALAMTGLIKAGTVDNARNGNWNDWEEASMYKDAIISAVRNSSLDAHSVTIWDDSSCPKITHPNNLRNQDRVMDVEVYTKELWQWFKGDENNVPDADPLDELKKYKSEFISLRELLITIQNKYPQMSINDIAEWLVKKLCYETETQVYEQGVAGKLYTADDDWRGDDNPFLMCLLLRIIDNGENPIFETKKRKTNQHLSSSDIEVDDIPF